MKINHCEGLGEIPEFNNENSNLLHKFIIKYLKSKIKTSN